MGSGYAEGQGFAFSLRVEPPRVIRVRPTVHGDQGSTRCRPIPYPIYSTHGTGFSGLGATESNGTAWVGRLFVSCQG